MSFSRRSSRPWNWTQVSHIVGRRFTGWATREVLGKTQNPKKMEWRKSRYIRRENGEVERHLQQTVPPEGSRPWKREKTMLAHIPKKIFATQRPPYLQAPAPIHPLPHLKVSSGAAGSPSYLPTSWIPLLPSPDLLSFIPQSSLCYFALLWTQAQYEITYRNWVPLLLFF